MYAAITEAQIDNYPGFFTLALHLRKMIIQLRATKLAPLPEEPEDGVKARFNDKPLTPWRAFRFS